MSLSFFLKAFICLHRYILHAEDKVQENHVTTPKLVQLAKFSHGPQFRHFAVSPEKFPVDKYAVTSGDDGISPFS